MRTTKKTAAVSRIRKALSPRKVTIIDEAPSNARTAKRRREIAAVLTELTTPELEIELLRRRRMETERAMMHETSILRGLQKLAVEQTAEINRQQALLDGGVR